MDNIRTRPDSTIPENVFGSSASDSVLQSVAQAAWFPSEQGQAPLIPPNKEMIQYVDPAPVAELRTLPEPDPLTPLPQALPQEVFTITSPISTGGNCAAAVELIEPTEELSSPEIAEPPAPRLKKMFGRLVAQLASSWTNCRIVAREIESLIDIHRGFALSFLSDALRQHIDNHGVRLHHTTPDSISNQRRFLEALLHYAQRPSRRSP